MQSPDFEPIVRFYLTVNGRRQTFEVSAEGFTRALFGEAETPCELVEVIPD